VNKGKALADIYEEMASCRKCPRLVEHRTAPVKGRGSHSARIMLIGEAPGEDEDADGEAFVGRSGGKINSLLKRLPDAGLDVSPARDFFLFNAVNCRPTHYNKAKDKLENATPTPAEIVNCRPWLHKVIRLLDPLCLILLGRVPCASFGITDALGKVHGKMIDVRIEGVDHEIIYSAVPVYHPSFLLRSADKPQHEENVFRALKGTVERAWACIRISQGLSPQPPEE